ncbi:MAG: ABC transporter permease [Microbacteriaceae bacterium]|nr:ABC transporter permease [Microbacteriaceae bacterium]
MNILSFGTRAVIAHKLRASKDYLGTVFAETFLSPVAYLFALGVGLGSLIDANGQTINGIGYLQFVAPALVCSTAMLTVAGELMWPILGGFRWNKIFEAMFATPISPAEIVRGTLFFASIRGMAATVVYTVVVWAFGGWVSFESALWCIFFSLLLALSFGICCLCLSAKVEQDSILTLFYRFIVMPLFLFSGTFFSLDTLPIYLQPIGWLSPLWHATQSTRALSYWPEQAWLAPISIIYLLLIFTVFYLASVRIFTRRLTK